MHYVICDFRQQERGKVMDSNIAKQARGRVKSFNPVKGYGFISCTDNLDLDIYFHYTQILMEGRRVLSVDDKVEFLYKEFVDEDGNSKGLRAYQIRKIDE